MRIFRRCLLLLRVVKGSLKIRIQECLIHLKRNLVLKHLRLNYLEITQKRLISGNFFISLYYRIYYFLYICSHIPLSLFQQNVLIVTKLINCKIDQTKISKMKLYIFFLQKKSNKSLKSHIRTNFQTIVFLFPLHFLVRAATCHYLFIFARRTFTDVHRLFYP